MQISSTIEADLEVLEFSGRDESGRRWSSKGSWLLKGAIPGKLLVDEATKLGVPRGPMLGELKAGRSVTLSDGTVVSPSSVTMPATPWSVSCYDFTSGFPDTMSDAPPASSSVLIISSTPSVRSDPRFKPWLEGQTYEYLVHPYGPKPPYLPKPSLLLAYKLHALDPRRFLMPKCEEEVRRRISRVRSAFARFANTTRVVGSRFYSGRATSSCSGHPA